MSNKKIVETFLRAQNRLVFQSSDLSLESISNMVEGGAINIKPKYQRRQRWKADRQSALIESFLLNIPVPPIYLAEDEYGKYSVIDGKQRITSIYNFIHRSQRLVDLEKFEEIEGLTFEELPTELNNALKIRPYVRVITLLKQSDPMLKYEVFNRLNTGGLNLLSQEIRNAAYEGELNDALIEMSEHKFLRKQLNINTEKLRAKSKLYMEMRDVEYVLRFFTLKKYWERFSGNMRLEMDKFMRENRYLKLDEIEEMKEDFNATVDLCERIWGDQAFKRPDGRNEMIQGIFDAQMVAVSNYRDKSKEITKKSDKIQEAFNDRYFVDEDFQISLRQFTSNIKQVEYRIGTMMEIIYEIVK